MDLFKFISSKKGSSGDRTSGQSSSPDSSHRGFIDRLGLGPRSRSRSRSRSQPPSPAVEKCTNTPVGSTASQTKTTQSLDIDTVWAEALKIATEKLGDNNLPLYLTNLSSQLPVGNIRAVIEALDTLQKAEKDKQLHYTWNGKKVVIVERVGKFLKTAEKYSPIVGTAIQSKPEVAAIWACVWATMRVCIHLLCRLTGTILIL